MTQESTLSVFKSLLEVKDIEGSALDSGGKGKKFERVLIRAFDLVGLGYDENRATGALWDVKTKGEGWKKLVSNKEVNIKIAGTRWMFGGAEFGRALPWDEIENVEAFDTDKAAAKVRKILLKRGVHKTVFLGPKTKDVEQDITKAVTTKDVEKLNTLLVKSNFKANHLGKGFTVRVSTKGNKIGSIAIEKAGKVWARSERPRQISGSMQVAFRSSSAGLKRVKQSGVKAAESVRSVLRNQLLGVKA
jgi:hypothetical protein